MKVQPVVTRTERLVILALGRFFCVLSTVRVLELVYMHISRSVNLFLHCMYISVLESCSH